MIKEALAYLAAQALQAHGPFAVGDRQYTSDLVHPVKDPEPGVLNVNTLSGLLDYLGENRDALDLGSLTVHIEGPTKVKVLSTVFGPFKQRACHLCAAALLPDFTFDQWIPAEVFVPALKARFLETEDLEQLIRLTGNIKHETAVAVTDDGITQRVEAKAGIARVESVNLPPILHLQPYRTFLEAEQPVSAFVYRVKEGPQCKLIEADGGAWRLQAMKNVEAYIRDNMPKECNVAVIV
jgi:hypothetical protein